VVSTEPLHRALGLTDDELAAISGLLGREPTDLELAMYGVLWSEHCSYKSSKVHLRRFPTDAPWVLVGPGEGAGVLDVGDGLAVAVRIESHNHPSAVEPYQGAATGVGGIIRDIFSMGARPIALMDPLRFGPLDDPRCRYVLEQVVAGISGYGNSVGVPTVGGEIVVDDCYRDNPLVNVLCVGVTSREHLVRSRAGAAGNLAVLLGASTGRDGIGGASVLASAAFEEETTTKRPAVQVGDPFEEKRLIEACLTLLEAGLAVGVQDLGAGGLSCAASEIVANSGLGMDVDVARVPRRELHMTPVEVMTSESQERMLAVVEPDQLDAVLAICERWDLRAAVVGVVTAGERFRVFDGAFDAPPAVDGAAPDVLADVPAVSLGDGPVYTRPAAGPPDGQALTAAADPAPTLERKYPAGVDLGPELLALLSTPTIADKAWVWRQYDHQLFLNTVVGPGADATVLRLPRTGRALALATDGKARFCLLDPRTGGRLVVLEGARNVACVGARPRAVVNCLNFGSPEHPTVMWQFAETVEGMAEACEALGLPVIGGNVSFYNASRGADIDPTPVVGVIGVLDELETVPPTLALGPDQEVVLLGVTAAELGGSEWATRHELDGGRPPGADLGAARQLHELVRGLVAERLVRAAHDCADGGVAVALAEMAIAGGCGVVVAPPGGLTPAIWCFSESASRVVVTVDSEQLSAVLGRADAGGVPAAVLGRTGGDRVIVDGAFDLPLDTAADAWRGALPRLLDAS
jgi:phosphoribosylformylglycinamidine synthase